MGSFRKNVLQETDAEVNARHAKMGQILKNIGLKALKEFEKKKRLKNKK